MQLTSTARNICSPTSSRNRRRESKTVELHIQGTNPYPVGAPEGPVPYATRSTANSKEGLVCLSRCFPPGWNLHDKPLLKSLRESRPGRFPFTSPGKPRRRLPSTEYPTFPDYGFPTQTDFNSNSPELSISLPDNTLFTVFQFRGSPSRSPSLEYDRSKTRINWSIDQFFL